MSKPEVSVLLPVYNGTRYLAESIQSILSQSFSDFELIIIDDGSTDDPAVVVKQFNDRRIIFTRQKNAGLAATLNKAIKKARGVYLARQDQDDISHPQRLAKQFAVLEARPRVGLVGSSATIMVEEQQTNRLLKHPSSNAAIQLALLFDNPFIHSSVMIRHKVLDRVGLYTTDKNRQPPEDYELWSRIARVSELANIDEPLLIYREVQGSMSRVTSNPFTEKVIAISAENIGHWLGKSETEPEIRNLAELYHRSAPVSANQLPRYKQMLQQLYRLAVDLPGAPIDQLKPIIQEALTRVDHHLQRPLADRLYRGLLYRLNPQLIDRRKAVRL